MYRRTLARPKMVIYLCVTQVHRERLERLQEALGVGRLLGPYRNGPGRQKLYQYRITKQKDVRRAMNLMWPYLGPTTKQRLRDVLDS